VDLAEVLNKTVLAEPPLMEFLLKEVMSTLTTDIEEDSVPEEDSVVDEDPATLEENLEPLKPLNPELKENVEVAEVVVAVEAVVVDAEVVDTDVEDVEVKDILNTPMELFNRKPLNKKYQP
jgi:hypothetical protein